MANGWGGRRAGAGRPKGSKSKVDQRIEMAKSFGMTPLEYLLREMNDSSLDRRQRLEAARVAAPYVHPKRAPLQYDPNEGLKDVSAMSSAQLLRIVGSIEHEEDADYTEVSDHALR